MEFYVCQSIIVRWDLLPEDLTNGVITGYRIRYRQSKDRRQTIAAVDGTQAQCVLSGKYTSRIRYIRRVITRVKSFFPCLWTSGPICTKIGM